MCRIAGIIANGVNPDDTRSKVAKMCYALQHGGPDDEGIFTDEKNGLVFGHRRLSIIDLSTKGHQPMADNQQKAWITFNGEIYNYLELREKLTIAGAGFNSATDTEVILQAYLHWGTDAFDKLRGIFAFALYDIAKATTYLVRDSSGIKPLYYYINNGQLSFASEVRALKLAEIATAEDETWRVRLLALGNIPEPYTTLKNVFSLPKGSFLCWNNNDCNCSISRYQTRFNINYITNKKHAEEIIHEALSNAVKRQLIADASIGVFLSGGIDSSLITLLAARHEQHQLKTISIYFDEKSYDESQYQHLIFKQINGEKFTHLVRQKDFDKYFPKILNAMDMPTTDGINSWFISNYAHQDGLKAVLSGIGGDELFGGYPSFKRIKYMGYLRKAPSALLKLSNYFTADRYKKISFLAHHHYLADYLLLRGLFTPPDIAKILDVDVKQVDDILFDTASNINLGQYNAEHAAWFETNLYMQNQLLRDTDVMGMNNGVEVRVPFLDEDFLRLVESISPEIRFDTDRSKKLLTDSFSDILPAAIWDRPKMGFTFPLQQWMKNTEVGDETLYKGQAAKNVVSKFRNDKMHWSKVFALYQIQKHD